MTKKQFIKLTAQVRKASEEAGHTNWTCPIWNQNLRKVSGRSYGSCKLIRAYVGMFNHWNDNVSINGACSSGLYNDPEFIASEVRPLVIDLFEVVVLDEKLYKNF